MKAGIQLPCWRCHKVVGAAKITGIGTTESARGGHKVYWLHLEGVDQPIEMPSEWMKWHRPKVGGYLVAYPDGYQSYSPAKAFEEGYTRI